MGQIWGLTKLNLQHISLVPSRHASSVSQEDVSRPYAQLASL